VEKISKEKHSLIDRFVRNPRSLERLFLSHIDKPAKRNKVMICVVLTMAVFHRTVARKFSKGGFCVCAGGYNIPKIDKNSTNLLCFMFQFGGLGALFGGLSQPKPPRGDGNDASFVYFDFGDRNWWQAEA